MLPKRLSIIDIETTGLSPNRDRIIEIGILRIEEGNIVDTFESLVNPNCTIAPEITMLTGITPTQLEHAPTFAALKHTIRDLLKDSMFVAHNARFDYSFIRSEFWREEESFRSKLLCTAKLSRRLFPRFRRHNLDSIIERFSIVCQRRHRALDDAKVLWEFLQKVSPKVQPNLFDSERLPASISQKIVDTLPQKPGVYIFYNRSGVPIYIGKSVNIRERVMSHFRGATTNSLDAKIFHSIFRLETHQTNGELGALILESQLIKTKAPLLNRALRKRELATVLFKDQTTRGYLTVRIEELDRITQGQIESIVGIYKTVHQAKNALGEISKDHHLCKKLLGLEKTHTRCFGYQLGTCFGACVGKEMTARYNMRFVEAFAKTKIRSWPFPGPIAIGEGKTVHVVSRWCLEGEDFDYDTYKILSRFLIHKKSLKLRGINVIPHFLSGIKTNATEFMQ